MGKNKGIQKGIEQSQIPKEATEVVIPSENVLFVGGQENFVSKMRKIYPNWTYLECGERNCKKVKGNYSLAIIKANHCSHNIIERALAHCGDIPVIYSNCTNVDRTIEEIKNSIQLNGLSFKMWDGRQVWDTDNFFDTGNYAKFLINLIYE